MHHLGPFLLALGCFGGTIKRGMPPRLRRVVENRRVTVVTDVLQQPASAAVLFVGLFYFWLISSVHSRAMINARLYGMMNWSMVLDGILFWWLALDPAAESAGARVLRRQLIRRAAQPTCEQGGENAIGAPACLHLIRP